jgi:WASH complex subunit 7
MQRFKYNLHQSFFIEPTSADAASVKAISVYHLQNSLRTHGLGVVNTLINSIYKFLGKKFEILSKFLYDNHI